VIYFDANPMVGLFCEQQLAAMAHMNVQTLPQPAPSLIGTVRRFGPHGVLYEIVKFLDDRNALIRVIDTGEETAYSLAKIWGDPTS
jgi:hypothetical protein